MKGIFFLLVVLTTIAACQTASESVTPASNHPSNVLRNARRAGDLIAHYGDDGTIFEWLWGCVNPSNSGSGGCENVLSYSQKLYFSTDNVISYSMQDYAGGWQSPGNTLEVRKINVNGQAINTILLRQSANYMNQDLLFLGVTVGQLNTVYTCGRNDIDWCAANGWSQAYVTVYVGNASGPRHVFYNVPAVRQYFWTDVSISFGNNAICY